MNYPTVRLEIEGMKHTILHHFTKYQEDLNKHVAEKLKIVIENFDYLDAVKKVVEPAIHEALGSYFKYGEGRSLLDDVISNTMRDSFNESKEHEPS